MGENNTQSEKRLAFYQKIISEVGLNNFFANIPDFGQLQDRFDSFQRVIDSSRIMLPDSRLLGQYFDPETDPLNQKIIGDLESEFRKLNKKFAGREKYNLEKFLSDIESHLKNYENKVNTFVAQINALYVPDSTQSDVTKLNESDLQVHYRKISVVQSDRIRLPPPKDLKIISKALFDVISGETFDIEAVDKPNSVDHVVSHVRSYLQLSTEAKKSKSPFSKDLIACVLQRIVWGANNDVDFNLINFKKRLTSPTSRLQLGEFDALFVKGIKLDVNRRVNSRNQSENRARVDSLENLKQDLREYYESNNRIDIDMNAIQKDLNSLLNY